MSERDFATDWAQGELEHVVRERHAVRQFTSEPVAADVRDALEHEVAACNAAGNLHMRLVWNDPQAFDSAMAHYGKFSGVSNYLVIAGAPADDLDERGGYWGERVVLLAQHLGLNSCWVALTFKRRHVRALLQDGDRMVLVVALGHGSNAGHPHRTKSPADVTSNTADAPAWFRRGVEWALLAPTANNQQHFRIELVQTAGSTPRVTATSNGGPYSKVDLGIAKLHFELGAGRDSFSWA